MISVHLRIAIFAHLVLLSDLVATSLIPALGIYRIAQRGTVMR